MAAVARSLSTSGSVSGSAAGRAAPSSAPGGPPNTVVRIMAPLPRLHYCCFMGDLAGVLECITEGHSIHEALSMQNQHEQIVCGITPLFLAAQRGHTKVCKLLVENGANPNQPSYIEGSTDLCTPAEVAQLNLHLMLARYLRKAVKQRRKEDAVITQDEEDTERVRQRTESMMSAGPAAVAVAGSPGTARAFMANLSDLSNWDPATGAPAQITGDKVAKMMQKQKIDLYSWKPEDEVATGSARVTAHGAAGEGTSVSRVVDPSELDAPPASMQDNGKMLTKFLKDLDLQDWNPQLDEDSQHRRTPGALGGRAPSGSMDLPRQGSGGIGGWLRGAQRGSIDGRGTAERGGLAGVLEGLRSSFNGRGAGGGGAGAGGSVDGRGATSMVRSVDGGELSTPPTPRSPRHTEDEGDDFADGRTSPTRSRPPARAGPQDPSLPRPPPPPPLDGPPSMRRQKSGPGSWRLSMGGLWNKSLHALKGGSGRAPLPPDPQQSAAQGEGAGQARRSASRARSIGRTSRRSSSGFGAEGGDEGADDDLPVSNSRVARPDDEEAEAAVREVLQRAREGR